MLPPLHKIAGWFLLLLTVAPWLQAQETLLSNLNNENGGYGYVTSSTLRAVSFTTSGTTFNITSATMRLTGYTTPDDTALLTFRVDNDGAPSDTAFATLQAPSSSDDGFSNFVFTATSTITLQADTLYWMVIASPNASPDFAWVRSDPVVTPTGIFTFGMQAISYNSGTNWQEGANGPHTFSIQGSAVPEPAAVLLLILGLTVFFITRKRGRLRSF